MIINKFYGKTREDAIEKAKTEMGETVVIMNVKQVKAKGLLRAFKSSTYEVTAAMEEKEQFVNPASALKVPLKMHDNINYMVDEPINVPVQGLVQQPEANKNMVKSTTRGIRPENDVLEEKLENLQNFLEKNLPSEDKRENQVARKQQEEEPQQHGKTEGFRCMKMIYQILLDNEVDEKYANQIMDDVEKVVRNGSNMDIILSNVYQKMILKFGQPKMIELIPGQPKVVFFIGPTGVGKTTTIAKIASKYKVDQGKKVAFLTADTYRIAASEQLRTYANILDAPLMIIYSAEEMNAAIERVKDYDLILVDTAGFSHKNDAQCSDMKHLIESVNEKYQKEVYLVVSATTKYKDLREIANIYYEIAKYKIIFTKLDETTTYGNILNIRLYSNTELSYTTNGQNVPDDIEIFNTQKVVKQLLGGK